MPTQIVILGGGIGGVYTALHLERTLARIPDAAITLVSRNNFFLMSPFLFEAGSGVLEPRHAVNPIRSLLKRTRFVEAQVDAIDLDRRCVHTRLVMQEPLEIPYDQLVLALGGVTNKKIIKGSETALTFKTLGDAILLRNRTIQLFERADVEPHSDHKRAQLTFVVIGGGFVGLELMGEFTEFTKRLTRYYKNVSPQDLHFVLIEAAGRIAPEFDEKLADYAAEVLRRRGVSIRTNTKVGSIEEGRVTLPDGEVIDAETIILSTGVVPSPVVANLPIEKTPRGAVIVEPTMRSKSRPEVWAMGDCASIPSPSGKPYPNLAQHALREAKVLAQNIAATLRNQPIKPFIYETVGNLAALGHYNGVGKIYGIRLRGFVAWWVWRSYYLFRMPQWRRRIRIMADWTVSLLFGTDIVQLDLIPEERLPLEVMRLRVMHPPAPSAAPTPAPTPAPVTTS